MRVIRGVLGAVAIRSDSILCMGEGAFGPAWSFFEGRVASAAASDSIHSSAWLKVHLDPLDRSLKVELQVQSLPIWLISMHGWRCIWTYSIIFWWESCKCDRFRCNSFVSEGELRVQLNLGACLQNAEVSCNWCQIPPFQEKELEMQHWALVPRAYIKTHL